MSLTSNQLAGNAVIGPINLIVTQSSGGSRAL